MADREVNGAVLEVPEMPEILERVLLYALNEGRQKMDSGEDVVPFTTLVVKDSVFLETHPGDNAKHCFDLAQHTIEGARGANAYAFCYDGFIETDDGVRDALIAEGGVPGGDSGYAIGFLYSETGSDAGQGAYVFDDSPSYIGESPNFMSKLKDSTEYTEADIDSKYLDDTFIEVTP